MVSEASGKRGWATQLARRSSRWRARRASRCCCTRTCTATTCSPRSASRGLSSTRSRSPVSASSRSHRSCARGSSATAERDVLYRFDRLTSELGLDRERARGWTIAQTVAWLERRVARQTAWLLEWLLCSKRSSSTSTSRSPSRGPISARRATARSAVVSASTSTRRRYDAARRDGDRDAEASSRARSRRGDLGHLHRADHPGDGRRRRHVRVRRRDDARVGAGGALRAVRRRAAGARRAARLRPQARAAVEHRPRPQRVRRAPRHPGRHDPDLASPRQDEAARDDLPRDP